MQPASMIAFEIDRFISNTLPNGSCMHLRPHAHSLGCNYFGVLLGPRVAPIQLSNVRIAALLPGFHSQWLQDANFTAGLAVSSGHGATHVVPVYEGHALSFASGGPSLQQWFGHPFPQVSKGRYGQGNTNQCKGPWRPASHACIKRKLLK